MRAWYGEKVYNFVEGKLHAIQVPVVRQSQGSLSGAAINLIGRTAKQLAILSSLRPPILPANQLLEHGGLVVDMGERVSFINGINDG